MRILQILEVQEKQLEFTLGNPEGIKRNNYRYQNGKFHCSQVNILIALNDIGSGDGGTVIIPSSHKSNIQHPEYKQIK